MIHFKEKRAKSDLVFAFWSLSLEVFEHVNFLDLFSMAFTFHFLITSMYCVSDLKDDAFVAVVVLDAELLSNFPQN